jgi:hypothetical protein
MDQFIYFATVSKDTQELLARYESPESETSIWKWIPICYLDQVRDALKTAGQFRAVFRGPRFHRWRASTNKKDAVAFTVYKL